MTRSIKKAVNPPETNQSKFTHHPYAEQIQRLKELHQPWNPVVRAAIELLERPKSPYFCDAVSMAYGYAELVQQKGVWQSPKHWTGTDLSNHAKRNAICIVLDGRVEAIGRQSIPRVEGRCSFSPAQPKHLISMERGDTLGAWEFTGNLFQHPETHGYEVLSGPVCIQFDHSQFNPFEQTTTTKKSGNNLASCAMDLLSHQVSFFKDWWIGGENYHLIKAFADESAIHAPHVELLFIDLRFPYLDDPDDRHAWEAFRNAIVETAWRQSRAARGRDFKAASVLAAGDTGSNDPIKGIEFEAYKATLIHLEEVFNGVGTLWIELQDTPRFPAIESFLRNPELNRLGISSGNIFLKEPILSLQKKMVGRLSIVDYISRYSRVNIKRDKDCKIKKGIGDVYGVRIERTNLMAWQVEDALADKDGFTILGELKKSLDSYVEKYKERNPETLSKIVCRDPIQSDNPFQRFWIEVDSGLDTLPAINWIEGKIDPKLDLSQTLIIGCQHFLRETCAWFAHLMSKGATIIAIGKDYSTCPEVARRLQRIGVMVVEKPTWEWSPGEYTTHLEEKARLAWRKALEVLDSAEFEEVIVVDDGGVLHKTAVDSYRKTRDKIKWRGVEQTTSGEADAKKVPYPVALVSSNSEKKKWESRIIAEKIFENSLRLCAPLSGGQRIGIIGAGAIATAVAERFLMSGYSVFWFSQKDSLTGVKVYKKQTLEELLDASDVIFGCAGNDVLKEFLGKTDSQKHLSGKWFISCSSSDTEFASLLKLRSGKRNLCSPLRLHNPFSTMVVQAKSDLNTPSPCFVLNGGFPVNFDRERDSVPLHLIQFTRALMHLGLLKARAITETCVVDDQNLSWGDFKKDVLGESLTSHSGK